MSLDTWVTPEYWQHLLPQLHIQDGRVLAQSPVFDVSDAVGQELNSLIVHEGYFQLEPPNWGLPLAMMAQGLIALEQQGWLPVFAFLYDEFWLLYHKLTNVMAHLLGADFKIRPDFWAWHVNPSKGESGWPPHRDGDDNGLLPDGRPKSLTVWIPLADSTPLNGCIYVVPRDRDPTYNSPQRDYWRFEQADVRAVPGVAGSVLCWNTEVLHWGAHSSPRAQQPRISVALEFQRADVAPFNQPLMQCGTIPDFPLRLRLTAKQILQWRERYPLTNEMETLALHLLGRS